MKHIKRLIYLKKVAFVKFEHCFDVLIFLFHFDDRYFFDGYRQKMKFYLFERVLYNFSALKKSNVS